MDKADTVARVRELVRLKPLGFDRTELRLFLNGHYTGDRLKDLLKGLVEANILFSPERNVYICGTQFDNPHAAGAGVALRADVRRAFDQAGGIIPDTELLATLGREDRERQGLVRATLRSAPLLYRKGISAPGMPTRWWHLTDTERMKLPLPGRWLEIDLRLTARAVGRTWTHGLAKAFADREAQIGAGLRLGRSILQADAEDMVGADDVGDALEAALLFVAGEDLRDNYMARVDRDGRRDALAWAWRTAERPTPRAPVIYALTTDFWRAAGSATRLEPALWSRGIVQSAPRGDIRTHFPPNEPPKQPLGEVGN